MASCAPEGSAYFGLTGDAYFAGTAARRPARWPWPKRPYRRRIPTGFGVPEAAALVTPVVLAVLIGTASTMLHASTLFTADEALGRCARQGYAGTFRST